MAAINVPETEDLVFQPLQAAPRASKKAGQAAPTIPAHLLDTITKLKQLGEEMKSFYVGETHHAVIDDMLLALTIGEHLLMLGDPGNGKSDMVNELCSRIIDATGNAAKHFHILLSKATDPSELVGGINIPEMQKTGRYERQTEGMMPEAFTAFIDECFKANSVVLNFMLGMINEREFTNAGKTISIPLHSAFFASNEGPESDELNAFYDRILFKHEIKKPDDLDQRREILRNIYTKQAGQWQWKHGRVTVMADHLAELAELATKVEIPDAIFDALKEIEGRLEALGRRDVTVRRMGKALKVLQGYALLNGRMTVNRGDCRALLHVLADNENDKRDLKDIIEKIAQGPYLSQMLKYLKGAQQKQADAMSLPEVTEEQRKAKTRAAIATRAELQQIMRSVNKCLKEAQAAGEDLEELKDIKSQIVKINAEFVDYVNSKVGVVNPVGDLNDDDLF